MCSFVLLQPLSMLLKLNPAVTHVSVFDMVGAPGVAADLSHIDTPAKVMPANQKICLSSS